MKKIIFPLLIIGFAAITVKAQLNTSPDRYTPELLWKLGRVSEVQVSPDAKTLLYGVTNYDLAANKGTRSLYTLPVSGGSPEKVSSFAGSEYNGIFRPDGKKIAFLSSESGSSQIWEANPDGSNPVKISSSAGDITGFSYAPDMKHILFTERVKLDATPNDLYPDLPKASARIEDDLMYRHWDSWSDYSYSHIFIAPYASGKMDAGRDIMEKQRYESPMAPWGGMEQINWSPDGSKIAYTCKKLTGMAYSLSTNSEIYVYDLQTGTETAVSAGLMGYDQDPVFSPDGKKLVWRSMARDGFEADQDWIMIYDFTSRKYRNYSENFDQGAGSFSWSADGQTVHFLSSIHGTVQVYALNTVNGTITPLSSGRFDYLSAVSAGRSLVVTRQSMLSPTEVYRIDENGKETQLTFTNQAQLKNVKSATVEERWMTTTDNKKMLVWVIYPPDFDAKKKYPALLFCEGGPQSMVSQFFSYRWNFQIMAANDYIVVAPNRRGLPGFGQEWNDQISGDYGGQNMNRSSTRTGWAPLEPVMAVSQCCGLPDITKNGSKRLYHIAECLTWKISI
jgi:dipeptidyl aminopeptidase/acylaminoacyl peptidase